MNPVGKIVDIYWNLNNDHWSVKHKGIVIGHAEFAVVEPIKFHVGESGRRRVLAEERKNVHAWVKGILLDYDTEYKNFRGTQFSYDPYMKNPEGFFFDVKTKLEVFPDDFDLVYFDFNKKKVYGK